MNFTLCLVDPLGEKAEIELRDTVTRKMKKNKETSLMETTPFIDDSLNEKLSDHLKEHNKKYKDRVSMVVVL